MRLRTRIKIASSGYFVAAAMSLAGLMSPEPWVKEATPLVVLALTTSGLLTLRFPTTMSFLGSLSLGSACLYLFMENVTSRLISESLLAFALTTPLFLYVFVALEQGIFAGLRLWWKKIRKTGL
jgi:hypothetical protein